MKLIVYALCFFLLNQNTMAEDFCDANLKSNADPVADAAAQVVNKSLVQRGFPRGDARGYAIIIAAMIASAAATTYLAASLPPNFQFLSQFVAQASTLGVYVLGASIWEPLSSNFRKMSFGMRSVYAGQFSRSSEDIEFEKQWHRTQELFSINAQMSRNIKTQFITSVKHNFYEAHQAAKGLEMEYAADQIAEAAHRQWRHFRDINPDDESVANVVRAAFSNHLPAHLKMKEMVWEKLRAMDHDGEKTWVNAYYQRLLDSWLKN